MTRSMTPGQSRRGRRFGRRGQVGERGVEAVAADRLEPGLRQREKRLDVFGEDQSVLGGEPEDLLLIAADMTSFAGRFGDSPLVGVYSRFGMQPGSYLGPQGRICCIGGIRDPLAVPTWHDSGPHRTFERTPLIVRV
jgi:hypothetical protein